MRKIITLTFAIVLLLTPMESFAASKKLTATSGQTSVSLKWTKMTAGEQKKVSGLAVFRNGKVVKRVNKKTASFLQKGLKAGTTYTFQIKSYKTAKQKRWYNKKTKKWQVKAPAKKYRGKSKYFTVYKYANYTPAKKFKTKAKKTVIPETLVAPKVSIRAEGDENLDVAVILNWNPIVVADKYKVYKGSEVFTISSDDLMWRDKNVDWSTTYTYKVSAIKGSKELISGAVSVKTPDEPKPLTSEYGYFTDVSQMYSYINEWRQDPANQWYTDINGNKRWLTKEDKSNLLMLVRDPELEKAAQQRAKEQWIVYYEQGKDIIYKHTRPDGQSYSVTIREFGLEPFTENMAWGTPLNRKETIFGDKDGWAETSYQFWEQGHRRAMLSLLTYTYPEVKVTGTIPVVKVGFGAFRVGNTEMIAMELAY